MVFINTSYVGIDEKVPYGFSIRKCDRCERRVLFRVEERPEQLVVPVKVAPHSWMPAQVLYGGTDPNSQLVLRSATGTSYADLLGSPVPAGVSGQVLTVGGTGGLAWTGEQSDA